MPSSDIVILGGGIVGLTTAALLSMYTDLNITVVDKNVSCLKEPLVCTQDSYDSKCIAITFASKQILQNIHVWSDIMQYRMGRYEKMLVWDQVGFGEINFTAQDVNALELGYIIENSIVVKNIFNKLRDSKRVKFLQDQPIKTTISDDTLVLHLSNVSLKTRLLIAADGAKSWVRRNCGIETSGWQYDHTAIVATVKSEHEHGNTAYQRFQEAGPLAFLPLDKPNISSIVWSSLAELNTTRMHMHNQDFCKELAHQFQGSLGNLTLIGDRKCFPLQMLHAHRYIDERIALIGDAVHVVHPLAGQGANLGLLDSAALSEVIINAYNNNLDIGSNLILRKYERWRKGHNIFMLALMDGFKRLFGSDISVCRYLRNAGLRLFDKNKWVKKEISRFAMGISGDLPEFCKVLSRDIVEKF